MHDLLAEYAPVLLKVCEDIYKNLHGKSIVRTANYDIEMEDIRQETTCVLLEIHLRSPHKFPIAPGYLYAYAYYRCLNMYRAGVSGPVRLYYLDHDEVLDLVERDRLSPDVEYDDKLSEIERQRQRKRIRAWLDRYGVDIDDQLGLDFALWWQGVSIRDISSTLRKAHLHKYPHSPQSVQKRLDAAFSELYRKTGLTRAQVTRARSLALKSAL